MVGDAGGSVPGRPRGTGGSPPQTGRPSGGGGATMQGGLPCEASRRAAPGRAISPGSGDHRARELLDGRRHDRQHPGRGVDERLVATGQLHRRPVPGDRQDRPAPASEPGVAGRGRGHVDQPVAQCVDRLEGRGRGAGVREVGGRPLSPPQGALGVAADAGRAAGEDRACGEGREQGGGGEGGARRRGIREILLDRRGAAGGRSRRSGRRSDSPGRATGRMARRREAARGLARRAGRSPVDCRADRASRGRRGSRPAERGGTGGAGPGPAVGRPQG